MNKKKYITPYCNCIAVGSINMMATSGALGNNEVGVYNEVTEDDAVMGNTDRGSNANIWDTEW